MAFTATRGWDRYTDLAQAHAALEKQVRAALATVVDRVVAMQRDKIEQAWIEFELERALPGRAQRLADRLRAAIDLADVLDVEAILGLREARLRIALENERLLTVPPRSPPTGDAPARNTWTPCKRWRIGRPWPASTRRRNCMTMPSGNWSPS